MNRIDYTADNSLITELVSLQSDVRELKTRQSISRALITRSYTTYNANAAWDIVGYSIPANTIHYFFLRFTGDGTQVAPFGLQYSQIYNGGTATANRLSDMEVADATGTFYSWYIDSTFAGDFIIGWVIAVNAGSSGATIWMKARTITTCKGGWTLSW